MNHATIRYLEAKRSVDDRALSVSVLDDLQRELPYSPTILEAGCGTGTMVPRMYERGIASGTYRGVDRDERVVRFGRYVRPRELRYIGHEVATLQHGFTVGDLSVSFACGDALTSFADHDEADLFVAAAFADLVPLDDLLDTIEDTLRPGGLAYVPLTFDGATIFQPDHPADHLVERAYHRAIDERSGRDPRAGRHLAERFREGAGELLSMAPSDWIVRPGADGYPADEAFFLGKILDFVATALGGSGRTNPDLTGWLETRRRQLEAGELTYVAHQYDFLYRKADD